MAFEHFPHGADIGIRASGETLAGAFEEAARGLTAVIAEPRTVRPKCAVAFACAAAEPELLLVAFLNALIYEMATRRMLFSRFRVDIGGNELTATAWGEAIDLSRHKPAVEVKGATLTQLKITDLPQGGVAVECVVDV